jgi:hypothetical protein
VKEVIRQAVIELLEDLIRMIGGKEDGTNYDSVK